jgi:hypothetical protein
VGLETIPQNDTAPSRISHMDFRDENGEFTKREHQIYMLTSQVMIGGIDSIHAEHSLMPVVKLIDFGIAEEVQDDEM